MRGRTNAEGAGNLAINGNIKQFKVAEGASVTAGDFVEYKEQINEHLFSNLEIDMNKCTQISENLALTVSGNSLLLLKMIENEIKIIDSYNSKIVQDYTTLNDGGIAVVVKSSPYFIKLKVENESFVYVCGADGTGTKYNWADVIVRIDNILWAFNVKSVDDEYGKRKFYAVLRKFDVSEYDKITFLNEVINEYSSSKLPAEGISKYGNIANSGTKCSFKSAVSALELAYVIGKKETYNSNSGSWINSYFTITVSCSGDYITVNTVDTENQRSAGWVGKSPATFFEKYVLDNAEGTCRIYNVESGLKTDLNIEIESLNTRWAKIEENRFVLDNGKMAVYEINKNTGEVNIVSKILTINANMYKFVGVLYLSKIISHIFTSKNEQKTMSMPIYYEEYTGQISGEIDTTSVKPYSGGAAMGVSSQSGISGEKIDVYVPKTVV